jgi:hypothetical protein
MNRKDVLAALDEAWQDQLKKMFSILHEGIENADKEAVGRFSVGLTLLNLTHMHAVSAVEKIFPDHAA